MEDAPPGGGTLIPPTPPGGGGKKPTPPAGLGFAFFGVVFSSWFFLVCNKKCKNKKLDIFEKMWNTSKDLLENTEVQIL